MRVQDLAYLAHELDGVVDGLEQLVDLAHRRLEFEGSSAAADAVHLDADPGQV
jgi:hypothetical protein